MFSLRHLKTNKLQTPTKGCLALWLIITLFGTIFDAHAAKFPRELEPQENINMSQIALPVYTMQQLSKHLTTLASREQEATSIQKRASHQLLSLAITLDLANQDARETYELYRLEQSLEAPSEASLTTAYDQVLEAIAWLENPSAGQASNDLSIYLQDAVQIFQQDSLEQGKLKDLAQWSSIMPQQLTQHKETPTAASTPEEMPVVTVPKPTFKEQFHIKESRVYAPVAMQKGTLITPIQMTLSPSQQNEEHTLIITSGEKPLSPRNEGVNGRVKDKINPILKNRHSSLAAYHSNVSILENQKPQFNDPLIAPIALMLETSIQNKPLKENLHICANILPNGKLTTPHHLWSFLVPLRQSESGGILIVAPSSKELLTQLLVYNEPEFFQRWEVYTAENLDEALTYGSLSHRTTNESSSLFKSIQELSPKMSIDQLTTNKVVRKRLIKILQIEPKLFSAECLLLQGSSKRPRYLSKNALISELAPVINKFSSFMSNDSFYDYSMTELSMTAGKSLHVSSRATLDALGKLIDTENQDLYKKALTVANNFKLETNARKRLLRDPYDNNHRERLLKLKIESMELVHEIKSDFKKEINAPKLQPSQP